MARCYLIFRGESIQIASHSHIGMSKAKDSPKPTSKSVSNKELKKIVLEMGADLVDTLDSIHNAILTTRKEIKRLHKRIDDVKPCEDRLDTSKIDTLPDSSKDFEGYDLYSGYIG